jgi:integrase
LTGQRREEVARCTWDEINLKTQTWTLSSDRTRNAKSHEVHLSGPVIAVCAEPMSKVSLSSHDQATGHFRISARLSERSISFPGTDWRLHDLRRTCVSGMARLGIAPHVADKILNHQAGTISGVAAVYQRHDFIAERREALDTWGAHVRETIGDRFDNQALRIVA